MKLVVGFKESQAKIRKTLDILTQKASFAPRKAMRIRPRDADETMALCRAVERTVRERNWLGVFAGQLRGILYHGNNKLNTGPTVRNGFSS